MVLEEFEAMKLVVECFVGRQVGECARTRRGISVPALLSTVEKKKDGYF